MAICIFRKADTKSGWYLRYRASLKGKSTSTVTGSLHELQALKRQLELMQSDKEVLAAINAARGAPAPSQVLRPAPNNSLVREQVAMAERPPRARRRRARRRRTRTRTTMPSAGMVAAATARLIKHYSRSGAWVEITPRSPSRAPRAGRDHGRGPHSSPTCLSDVPEPPCGLGRTPAFFSPFCCEIFALLKAWEWRLELVAGLSAQAGGR